MKKRFIGVWGTFAYVDDAARVITALHEQKKTYSVMSPCPRHELTHAMGSPQSILPFITLACGMIGIFFGFGYPIWTAMDWVLPVSQKPIIGIPAISIIGFEMLVLFAGLGTAVGIFLLGAIDLMRKPLPSSNVFKAYTRFSEDRFGVIISCQPYELAQNEALLQQHGAEEVVSEK